MLIANWSQAGREPQRRTVELPAGRLEIEVFRSDLPLEDLCGFAGRHNPARAYLFVSKVLGKHYPVRPSQMSRVHGLLAQKVQALNLQPPVVVIALAETATGLGQGLFEACLDRAGPADWLFLHTTRYALRRPRAFQISEDHCHAREHLIYQPCSERGREIFESAQSLLLVDDEMSTGNTLLGLAEAFIQRRPGLRRVALASLTCWLDEARRSELAGRCCRPLDFVSLLDGAFTFSPRAVPSREGPAFKSVGDWAYKDELLPVNFGRLGLCAEEIRPDRPDRLRRLAGQLDLEPGRPVLVLGTGEFLHQPYLLARFLEEEGREVFFQSTSRTPAAVGLDLGTALRFADNYHEGLDNFLYNVPADSDSQKVICYETAPLPPEHDLPRRLKARTLFFTEPL